MIDLSIIYLRFYIVSHHPIIMKNTNVSKNSHKETMELSNKCAIIFQEIKKVTESSSKEICKGIVECPHPKKY